MKSSIRFTSSACIGVLAVATCILPVRAAYAPNTPSEINGSVRVAKTPTGMTISWDDAPGDYNVYRGSNGPGGPWLYNQACLAYDLGASQLVDPINPPPHRVFYYLISRLNPPLDESAIGRNSHGIEDPNLNSCPNAPLDSDGDGIPDVLDNCRSVDNPDQLDSDGDSHGDVCDNCLPLANPSQEDLDGNNIGDACDADIDGDGILNGSDNCPTGANPGQADLDDDGLGDVCDDDIDGDETPNESDNCPTVANLDQTDTDQDEIGDACECVGVVCSADACHVAGVCDPTTGVCSTASIGPDGISCNDGDSCTQTDTCQAGTCVGGNSVVCSASDQCHDAGTCDPEIGQCTNPATANGTACFDDDACTQTDTCQAGACVGSNPVVCAALDQCHEAGTCDPATGVCSNPGKPNGTACSDGNACTEGDNCQAGTCTGANLVVDGTACSDGNACTQTASCQSGICTGGNPVVCTASDQCHLAGTCNPAYTGTGFTVLQNFDDSTTGGYPAAGMIRGTDGALYGTTQTGGSSSFGTVFKLNPDGTGFTVLQNFDNFTTGGNPSAGLIQGTDGALYGTTQGGGSIGYGTVFKLNPDGTGFTVLQNFYPSGTGAYPWAVIQGTDGALYGTATAGGSSGHGTVFKLNPDGTGFTILQNFDAFTTGGSPRAGLMQGTDGALYGTASVGGSGFYGTVFKLNPDGTGFTVLKNLDNSTTGGNPASGLMQGTDGALYGTTHEGGSSGDGTVFKLNPDGTGFTVLHNFDNFTTGRNPRAGLMQWTDGALYGTAYQGGTGDSGTVFKLNPDGTGFTVLQNFDVSTTGGYSVAGLIQGTAGALYGTAQHGGSNSYGTVFRLNPDGTDACSNPVKPDGSSCNDANACRYDDVCTNGTCGGTSITCASDQCNTRTCNGTSSCTETPLTGNSCEDGNACTEGDSCQAGTCAGSFVVDGTTCDDGNACTHTDTCQSGICTEGDPVVCTASDQCHLAGTCNPAYKGTDLTILKGFDGSEDGGYLVAGLLLGTDGALYGTTPGGGSNGYGTVFKLNSDGTDFTIIKSFDGFTTGNAPQSGLMQGTDGALYGTTYQGGSSGYGTVFKLNPDGTGFTVLQNFDYFTTGGYIWAGLMQGTDGALYGTAREGGSGGEGTVFKLNPNGTGFTVLKTFDNDDPTTGHLPLAKLMQGTDGALYGTAESGGIGGTGTVFKLNPDGTGFTAFNVFDDYYTTGGNPVAGLIQGTDGALYGTAFAGGVGGYGTVFKLNLDGTGFTVLQSFDYTNGSYLRAGLMQGADGALYGTAQEGGSGGSGTVFKLNLDGTGFTVLQSFTSSTTGGELFAGLVQGTDGALYGTAYQGGSGGYGTVFKLNLDGTAACSNPAKPDGSSCNDANACTYGEDVCTNGTCGGPLITSTSDPCISRTCNGTSSCTETPLTGNSCEDGNACTEGDSCQAGTCTSGNANPCQNGGTCDDGGTSHTCTCPAGFTGTNCEINIDDCSPNPCQNGGTCNDGVSGYTCACSPGYTGTNCESDIDECTGGTANCSSFATCTNTLGSFICTCNEGYSGNGVTCTPICGNGVILGSETCDQGGGNVANGNGCSSSCTVETGYVCTGTPSVCTTTCGDGIRVGAETCDQGGGNVANGDGCSSSCAVETDYVCTGTPSVCTTICGDGLRVGAETCDQGGGNVANGDGCSSSCTVETGFVCTGTPSVCTTICGDGIRVGGETCDQGGGNVANGDGCSSTCVVETGFVCTGTPSVCTTTCGDGIRGGAETCDQGGGNVANGDGCSSTCVVETGFVCTGTPSVCTAICGDGLRVGAETCDQGGGNVANGDGCSSSCAVEPGYVCTGTPSVCTTTCGDGIRVGAETCDQGGGNVANGDGCSSSCAVEPGYVCTGTPSVCTAICGDGIQVGAETCDQGGGNVVNGDGCSSSCAVEPGYVCTGTPSVCTAICGNGLRVGAETCDQGGGNVANGDGCSSSCAVEPGYVCTGTPSVCVSICVSSPDGTTCDDGNAATPTDICSSGACVQCVPNPSASPRFVDNGNGTVTDRTTCLVWEKKTGTYVTSGVICSSPTACPDLHNVNNRYAWTSSSDLPNGPAFTVFLVQLNAAAFAGHTDWRLPSEDGQNSPFTGPLELQSIVETGHGSPTINPIFGPTSLVEYWSSSTRNEFPNLAWWVYFGNGFAASNLKSVNYSVRAVRGGP